MRTWFPVALAGCAPAVQAPDTIEEMVVFAFARFDDPPALGAVAPEIRAWADTHETDAADGFAVAQLAPGDLEAAGVRAPDVDDLLGALGIADYRAPLDVVVDAITSPDRASIYPNTESFGVSEVDGDRTCFLAGDCLSYAFTSTETTRVPLLGRSDRVVRNALRWVDDEAGVRWLVMRQVAPDGVSFRAEVPLMAIDQQYGVVVLGPRPDGGVRRVEAFWVEARVLGADVPEGFAVQLTVRQFQDSADAIDAWAGYADE